MTPARPAGSSTHAARCRGDQTDCTLPGAGASSHRTQPSRRRTRHMTTKVRFSTNAGEEIVGALCVPPGAGKTGARVVVHEGYGRNEVMKLHCEHFAQAGFLALAPDRFQVKVANNDREMTGIISTFDFQK